MTKLTTKLFLIILFILAVQSFAQVPVMTNPQNQTVTEGETASFSVTVIAGLLPVTYQWQVTLDQNPANFANIPGANSSSYTTPPTTTTMNNSWYRCVVTNDSGSATSNYATLTVNPIIAPSITTHPSNQNIYVGQTATFSVSATGTEPLTYQWYANSIAIPGATSPSYTTDVIDDITFDGTIIYCVVSNAGGDTESNSATLNVSYENVRITDGLQVLYNFKEGSGTTVADESGVGTPLNLNISNTNNISWTSQGLNVVDEVRIKSETIASKIINACTASDEVTFEAWFIPSDMIQNGVYARIMTMTNTSRNTSNIKLDQFGTDYNFHVRTTSTGLNGETYTNTGNTQKLVHYVATKDNSGNVKVYLDGVEVVSEILSGTTSNWDNSYYLYLGSDAENGTFWKGTFYLTAIYSKALSESEVNQNFLFGVDSDSFPYITKQPVDVFLKPVGSTATFSVEVIGNAPLSYQWYRNNNPIAGANSPSYTTPSLNLGNDNDTYKCVITSNDGQAESSSASLTVTEPDERITLDMIAQYTFTEGNGNTVNDVSGVGSPLDLAINTPDAVEWVEDGLEIISEPSIASVLPASKIYTMCTTTNELTIETWIRPGDNTAGETARLVTFSKDLTERNFSLSQEGTEYSTRLRSSNTTTNGFPYVITDNSSVVNEPHHVVYVFRGDAVGIIFVNGVEIKRRTLGGDFSTWDSSFRFGIANEFVDSRPWTGVMNYLAIFNRRLTAEEVLHNYNVGPYEATSEIAVPSELTAVSSEVGKITLNWVDNATNEDRYIIERNSSDPSSWEQIASIAANSTSFIDSTVQEGTNYDYRVVAFNAFLNSTTAISNQVNIISILNSPTGLVGNAGDLGKITLDWSDNSGSETGFNIERGLAEEDPVTYTVIGSVGADVTSYDDFEVEEGIEYSYQIRAFNDVVSSNPSNVLNIRSKASFVSAPSNLNIELHPIYAVPVLTWNDNAFNEIGFIIERRMVTIGSTFIKIDTLDVDETSYIDVNVSDSTSYIYRVFAFNDDYVSEASAEVYIDVVVVVGTEGLEVLPAEFSLAQNYPNPFNPSTTIKFNLPESSDVVLEIYNLLGQKLFTIVDGYYSAGSHSVLFNAEELTSGLYLYTITASSSSGENFVQTKKLVLLK